MKTSAKFPKQLKATLLDLLSRRDYTQAELFKKLSIKGYASEDIAEVIDAFSAQGYINDHRYVESYIYNRKQKGFGPYRIEDDLKRRGIKAEMIAEQLHMTDNSWFLAAKNLWQKRFKGKYPKDVKERIKQMRFLQARGFDHDHIKTIFKDSKNSAKDDCFKMIKD